MGKALEKIGKILWDIIQVVIIVYVLFITFCVLFRNKFGYTQFDKITLASITEEEVDFINDVNEGDLLLVRGTRKINIGDLIYYYYADGEHFSIRSGYVKDVVDGETTSLYVLNDKYNSNVASTRVLGKESAIYPKLGAVLNVLESKFGFLFLVLLPLMVVFIYQIWEFVVVLKYETVDDEVQKKVVVAPNKAKKTSNDKNNDDIEVL